MTQLFRLTVRRTYTTEIIVEAENATAIDGPYLHRAIEDLPGLVADAEWDGPVYTTGHATPIADGPADVKVDMRPHWRRAQEVQRERRRVTSGIMWGCDE
jgi:hypothetical protein